MEQSVLWEADSTSSNQWIGSLPCSQKSVTSSYPESDQSSPHSHPVLEDLFLYFLHSSPASFEKSPTRRFTPQNPVCTCSSPHTSLGLVMNIHLLTLSIFLIAKCSQGEWDRIEWEINQGNCLPAEGGDQGGTGSSENGMALSGSASRSNTACRTDLLHVLNCSHIFKALELEPVAIVTGVHRWSLFWASRILFTPRPFMQDSF